MIPEEYDGLGESLLTYALCVEEIARGWMSVSGVINTHFIVAYMLMQHGTEEQKQKYLPRMATGEVRGSFSMSEPALGSDVAAIKTKAVKGDDGDYTIDGQKMWLTNGGTSNLIAVLVKTDEGADSVYKNMTTFLVEKEVGFGETAPGLTIPGKIDKMGYKGVDTTEAVFEGHQISAEQILGGEPGKGFYQMMDGVEVGRVNVAARAVGIANRAFELGIAYAQQRETFGKPIAEHQAILFRLAEMATKVETSHAMMVRAARIKDQRRAQRRRGRDGQDGGCGVLQRGRPGLLPDPRRLRLLQGVRDRAPLPRGRVHADRRGHLRHPEDDHRPQPAQGLTRRLRLQASWCQTLTAAVYDEVDGDESSSRRPGGGNGSTCTSGLPKSGSTFLQSVLAGNRAALQAARLRLSVRTAGGHVPRRPRDGRNARVTGGSHPSESRAPSRACSNAAGGSAATVVISHEIFGAANARQVEAIGSRSPTSTSTSSSRRATSAR